MSVHKTQDRFLTIAVAHDGYPSNTNGKDQVALEELVDVLLQSETIPATLCFYTEGVRWLIQESPLLGQLAEIRRRGADIVVCRACLAEAGLLDQVAQRFPRLCMVVCHLGHPWITDAVMVIRKHRNVYGDISGFGFRRWRFYEALATAVEYDVGHKLLFGSDYPICTVEASIEYLHGAMEMAKRAGLPPIPQNTIEELLQRDSLKLLGMD